MFQAGQPSERDDETANNSGSSSPAKIQYTVKGIEEDAVNMMREAANRDGMKIGAWVSSRMKAAARQSLDNYNRPAGLLNFEPSSNFPSELLAEAVKIVHSETKMRFDRIESELNSITSAQRVIMTRLLEKF